MRKSKWCDSAVYSIDNREAECGHAYLPGMCSNDLRFQQKNPEIAMTSLLLHQETRAHTSLGNNRCATRKTNKISKSNVDLNYIGGGSIDSDLQKTLPGKSTCFTKTALK